MFPKSFPRTASSLLALCYFTLTAAAVATDHNGYRSAALAGGDVGRGRRVFEAAAIGCAACHGLPGDGGGVGPDLKGIGRRDATYLLDAVLEPAKDIAAGYGAIQLETADGKAVSGTFLGDDGQAVTVRGEDGRQYRVPKAAIQERTLSSPMPDGLHAQMTRQEFADLIAYLKAQR